MTTYREIQQWAKEKYHFTIKTCWIADVKAQYGKTTRIASNRLDPSLRAHPCPESKRLVIEEALRHFSII